MARSTPARGGWGPPPARRARDALDDHASVSALLAGHRRAHACFAQIRPLLPDPLAELVRPGPIDEGTWTLFAEHASAAAKLRQLLPDLLAAVGASDPAITGIKVKILPRDG